MGNSCFCSGVELVVVSSIKFRQNYNFIIPTQISFGVDITVDIGFSCNNNWSDSMAKTFNHHYTTIVRAAHIPSLIQYVSSTDYHSNSFRNLDFIFPKFEPALV